VPDSAIVIAVAVLMALCGCALLGCGDKDAPRAGCGRFCQQAGPLQAGGASCSAAACGRSDCPAYGCPPCPPPGSLASQRGCVDILTDAARMVDGTVEIAARCRWTSRCEGALVLFRDPGRLTPEGRLGAADLMIAPGRSARIRVGLGPGRRRFLSPGKGSLISAVVVLKWAQGAPDTSQMLRIAR
jgi:hypothetical protein